MVGCRLEEGLSVLSKTFSLPFPAALSILLREGTGNSVLETRVAHIGGGRQAEEMGPGN